MGSVRALVFLCQSMLASGETQDAGFGSELWPLKRVDVANFLRKVAAGDLGWQYRKNFHTIKPVTTKHRFRNKYRLQLREKDHEPMHVHLVGGEVNAKFDLTTLALVAGTVPSGVLVEVNAWLQVNQVALIEEWKSWQI